MKNKRICSMEVLDWLKKRYGNKLHPEIVSVKMYQDAEDVWVSVVKKTETEQGDLMQEECIGLDFIRNVVETDAGWREGGCTFIPERSLLDNAREFFMDHETLLNATPLFDE